MKRNFALGVLIILIGVLWLLSNLNIFPFSVGTFLLSLRSLWPLLLIGIGLGILFRENPVIRLFIWIIIFLVILLYGILVVNDGSPDYRYNQPGKYTESHDYNLSKKEATDEGKLNLNLGAGDIRISSTVENLVQFRSNIPEIQYDHRYENNDKKVIMDITKEEYHFNLGSNNFFFYMDLHEDVNWEMDLNLGAAKADLDFRDLVITDLDLDVGAADLKLTLGEKSESGEVSISAGASNIDIYVPEDTGLKIRIESALSNDNLDKLGLINKDGYLESPDFESKSNRYELTIKMGVGNLTFHRL